MSDSVKIQGPSGVYSVNELFFKILNAAGMSIAVHGNTNVSPFLQDILENMPELKRSGISEQGYFIWERGNTKIIWCMIADPANEYQSSAIFTQASADIESLPRMYIDLQNSYRAIGLEVDGIFSGEASKPTELRLRGATIMPAQILLGLDWNGN